MLDMTVLTPSRPVAPLTRVRRLYTLLRATRWNVSLQSVGNAPVGLRHRQISKARQTAIGSALVLRPRYLAVLSIFTWPNSARTVCKSPSLSRCGELSSGEQCRRVREAAGAP